MFFPDRIRSLLVQDGVGVDQRFVEIWHHDLPQNSREKNADFQTGVAAVGTKGKKIHNFWNILGTFSQICREVKNSWEWDWFFQVLLNYSLRPRVVKMCNKWRWFPLGGSCFTPYISLSSISPSNVFLFEEFRKII